MKRIKEFIIGYKLLFSLISIYLLAFLLSVYFFYQHIGAFGCFDDCFNYMGGYFLEQGKHIYTDFFFNHAPLMPLISFFIQKITHPATIYSLILFHKLFFFTYSLFMGLFLVFRFRTKAALALIFFELTKFYVFGDHFLGESFVVYPLLYLFGLVWEKLNRINLSTRDYTIAGLLSWFVIFTREPYIPLTLLLLVILFLGGDRFRAKLYSLIVFFGLSSISLLFLPVKDIVQNVYLDNRGIIGSELTRNGVWGVGIISTIFYPIRILVEGKWNIFRQILAVLNLYLIGNLLYAIVKLKKYFLIIVLLILAAANIRPTIPGLVYYEAYHMIVWYGLFLFTVFSLLLEIYINQTKRLLILCIPLFGLLAYLFVSPSSYMRQRIDRNSEINTNFANYYAYGTVIRDLAGTNDTLFLDETEDLIYWVANIHSSYKYSWYTAHMPLIPRYSKARTEMFEKYPPTFYYDDCQEKPRMRLSGEIINHYQRLKLNNKPSCLLVEKTKLNQVSKSQAESIKSLGFSLN